MRWVASIPCATALLVMTAAAHASPQARLVYARGDGAEVCPDESALRRAVGARIGYDPFFPWAEKTVVVSIERREHELSARVQLVEADAHAHGAREFTAAPDDCVGLVDRIALTISIAIDPRVLTGAAPPVPLASAPPQPVPPSPAPATPPAPEPLAPAPAERSIASAPSRPRARFALAALGVTGNLPSAAGGFAIAGGVAWRAFSVGLEGAVDLASSRGVPGGSVSGSLASLAAVPCGRWSIVHVCGLATFGRFEGSASGLPAAHSQSALYAAVGARAGAELPLGAGVALFADADALGDLARATLRVGTAPEWKASAVSGALSAGVAT
jgi:hypothetical protein